MRAFEKANTPNRRYYDMTPQSSVSEAVQDIDSSMSDTPISLKESLSRKVSRRLSQGYRFASGKISTVIDSARDRLKNKPLTEEDYHRNQREMDILARRQAGYEKRLQEEREEYSPKKWGWLLGDTKENRDKGESIMVLGERKRIIQERTAKLQKIKDAYEDHKLGYWGRLERQSGRRWDSLRKWVSNKENLKKLGSRLLIGAGMSVLLAQVGIGAGVTAGLVGAVGGFAGQGVGSAVYEKLFRKDFRRKLIKARMKSYEDRLNDFNVQSEFAKTIRRQRGTKKAVSLLGGFLFSAGTRIMTSPLYGVSPETDPEFFRVSGSSGAQESPSSIHTLGGTTSSSNIEDTLGNSSEARDTIQLHEVPESKVTESAVPMSPAREESLVHLRIPEIKYDGGTTTSTEEITTQHHAFGTDNTHEHELPEKTSVRSSESIAPEPNETSGTPETQRDIDTSRNERVSHGNTESVHVTGAEQLTGTTEHGTDLKDIYINKGEGVTNAFVRQIEKSDELRKYFGLDADATSKDIIRAAAKAARETGYITDTGDVRVLYGEGRGYELLLDETGKLKVTEYTGNSLDRIREVVESVQHEDGLNQIEVGGSDNLQVESGETNSETTPEIVEQDAVTGLDVQETQPTINREVDTPVDEISGHHLRMVDDVPLKEVSEQSSGTQEVVQTVTERYIPPVQSLGTQELRDYGFSSPMSQSHLPEHLGSRIIPQKIIDLFQNPENPRTYMQIDSPQESALIFEAMGIENNNVFGTRFPFRSVVTGEKLTFEDIYERVDLEKLKQEVERLRKIKGGYR